MIRNYLTVAVRHLLKHSVFSLINVAGLTLGMTCCVVVALFVSDELRFDRHHSRADRIYRLIQKSHLKDGQGGVTPDVTGGFKEVLKELPEVALAARVMSTGSWLQIGEKRFDRQVAVVDPEYFDMFDVLSGGADLKDLLEPHGSILATEGAADLFGVDAENLGAAVKADYVNIRGRYGLAGIIPDVVKRSDFRFDFITTSVMADDTRDLWEAFRPGGWSRHIQLYVMLTEQADAGLLERRITDLVKARAPPQADAEYTYHLQPLSRLHLYGTEDYGMRASAMPGDISQVRSLSLVGALILLMACMNFTNLATARASVRAQEVGVRKAIGARRAQLARQFLGESLLVSFVALGGALVLTELVLPDFNAFIDKSLTLAGDTGPGLVVVLLGITGLVGLAAGAYPALLLSRFHPASVARTGSQSGGGVSLRRLLVVGQFAVSIGLIAGTVVISQQLDFIRHKDLGFTRDEIVLMPIFRQDMLVPERNGEMMKRFETVKAAFREHPNVEMTSVSGFLPGMVNSKGQFLVEETGDTPWRLYTLTVDEDFFGTYGVDLVAGRPFDKTISSDAREAFILNETAVRNLGLTDPVGQTIRLKNGSRAGTVIGVVKDFQTRSLHERSVPVVLYINRDFIYWLVARIKPHDVPETLVFFEEQWNSFLPERPFWFQFLNDRFDAIYYQREIRLGTVIRASSWLAVVVACLGLFGLAAFTIQQRRKEIGIRKTLGAPVSGIVAMLSGEFTKLVVAANLLAWPVAYFALRRWLDDFAYQIPLTLWPFLAGGAAALVVALATVSYQSVRASLADPVVSLRENSG